MTKTERDALVLDVEAQANEAWANGNNPMCAALTEIMEKLAALPVSDAEPVAWRWHYGGGHVGPWHEMTKFHKPAKEIEYAYAAPPTLPDGWVRSADKLPPFDIPVWCVLEGGGIILGTRTDCYEDGWLWTNCYGHVSPDPDGGWMADDAESDDDYQVVAWHPLPDLKSLNELLAAAPKVPR